MFKTSFACSILHLCYPSIDLKPYSSYSVVDLGEDFHQTGYYNHDTLDEDKFMKHCFRGFLLQWG